MSRARKLVRSTILASRGQVTNDSFSEAIEAIAAAPAVLTALEVGASSGAGSTRALISGMKEKRGQQLHCLETSPPRFAQLSRRYRDVPWVTCHNLASVLGDDYPSEQDVTDFYEAHPESPLRHSPLKEVLQWLRQDLDTLRDLEQPRGGIEMVKQMTGIETFDLALIDGSEFTGSADVDAVYGAGYILLDDTRTFKNSASYARLSADPAYRLEAEDRDCRNGFAAFRLVEAAEAAR